MITNLKKDDFFFFFFSHTNSVQPEYCVYQTVEIKDVFIGLQKLWTTGASLKKCLVHKLPASQKYSRQSFGLLKHLKKHSQIFNFIQH